MSAETIIQTQVKGYNTRDIELFASAHADDVQLYNFGKAEPFCIGNAKLREIYGAIFQESPNLHTEILNRMVMGNTVIDHEIVTGRNGVEKLELAAIYEVENEKIARAYFKRRGW
jgi:hypothetical protein